MGNQHSHTIFSVAVLNGTATDRTQKCHLPVALFSCGEAYDEIGPLLKQVDAEIAAIKANGIPFVAHLCAIMCY